jgi:hypothetical protein
MRGNEDQAPEPDAPLHDDPDARLKRKGGEGAKLCYSANVLMENRNGLIVDTEVVHASRTAEWDAAFAMLNGCRSGAAAARWERTRRDFVAGVRGLGITPHVAQNTFKRRSAIHGRTTRHADYRVSQRKRKLVEQGFGWDKTVGLLHKLRHRGRNS